MMTKQRKNSDEPALGAGTTAFLRRQFVHQILIILTGVLIYSNTFHVPFVFDDISSIVYNSSIHEIRQFLKSISLSDGRFVGMFTFALNYTFHGTDVVGYHVFNIIVHLSNALLVYWLVVLIFKTPYFNTKKVISPVSGNLYNLIALCTALLFVSHPVQTQAVTYIVQRLASLSTLFYLLSLLLYLAWRLSSTQSGSMRHTLYACSLVAAVLAMRTKEIAVTLPAIIVLCEIFFFSGSIRKRSLFVIPFVIFFAAVLVLQVMASGSFEMVKAIDTFAVKSIGEREPMREEYLLTQFRVIVTYLRLLVLPVNQNLDYDYPVYTTFFHPEVTVSFLLLFSIISVGGYLTYYSRPSEDRRHFQPRMIAFGIFWFFITVSVESSIIPIHDVIMEHRVYLPSVGFFIAAVSGWAMLVNKLEGSIVPVKGITAVVVGTAVLALAVSTYMRNDVWRDHVAFYEDIVQKSPEKDRPHFNLGVSYLERGFIDKAAREFETTLLINPANALAHYNLASLYMDYGYHDLAIKEYQALINLNPDSANSHLQLGILYYSKGFRKDALHELQTALRLKPDLPEARRYLDLLTRK